MTRDDHEAQATQFIAWHRKRNQSWEADFEQWSRSKQLLRRDYIAIKSIVVNELTASGPAVPTESVPQASEPEWPSGEYWVCANGHAGRSYLKSEALGYDACLSCRSPVRLFALVFSMVQQRGVPQASEVAGMVEEMRRHSIAIAATVAKAGEKLKKPALFDGLTVILWRAADHLTALQQRVADLERRNETYARVNVAINEHSAEQRERIAGLERERDAWKRTWADLAALRQQSPDTLEADLRGTPALPSMERVWASLQKVAEAPDSYHTTVLLTQPECRAIMSHFECMADEAKMNEMALAALRQSDSQ